MTDSALLRISAIIPAYNSEHSIANCLRALCSANPPLHEIILVDDCSNDRTVEIATQFNTRVIRESPHIGANHCRNRGAREATGDILLFIDSDIVVASAITATVHSAFLEESTDAVVGIYSAKHPHSDLASQYKNLWIRYSYLKSNHHIDWIFGAVAAVRKPIFWDAGGFDGTLFMKHGGEDLELGKRMSNSAYRILLRRDLEVIHLKRHTLSSLLKNDFYRSGGFAHLATRLGQLGKSFQSGFANIYPSFIYSIFLAWCIVIASLIGFWDSRTWVVAAVWFLFYLIINAPFLHFLSRHLSIIKVAASVGILFLDHLVSSLGSIRGVFRWLRSTI
ncbi:MAG: glycosyltransferase [bacterium]